PYHHDLISPPATTDPNAASTPPSRPPLPDRPGDNAYNPAQGHRATPAARRHRSSPCAYPPHSQISKKGNGGRKIAFTTARSLLRFGSGNFTFAGCENKSAKTCSRGVRRPRWLRHALTTHAATTRLIPLFAVHHATQRQ